MKKIDIDVWTRLEKGTRACAKMASIYLSLLSATIMMPGYLTYFHSEKDVYKWMLSSWLPLSSTMLTVLVLVYFIEWIVTKQKLNKLSILVNVAILPIETMVGIGALAYVLNKNVWGWWLLFATAAIFSLLNRIFEHMVNKRMEAEYPFENKVGGDPLGIAVINKEQH